MEELRMTKFEENMLEIAKRYQRELDEIEVFFNEYKNAYEYNIYENAKFNTQRKFLNMVKNNIKKYCDYILSFERNNEH